MQFCKAFNAARQSDVGLVIPVVISVYQDKSFTFELKSPPAATLLDRLSMIFSAFLLATLLRMPRRGVRFVVRPAQSGRSPAFRPRHACDQPDTRILSLARHPASGRPGRGRRGR